MNKTRWKKPNIPAATERQINNLIAQVEQHERHRAIMLEALESAERCLAVYDSQGANNIELHVVRRAIQTAKAHPPA